MSAQGKLFRQPAAIELSKFDELLLICGRYEGVDERVSEYLADEEISIGDFVLSGGELGATVIIDTVARLIPGVLGNEDSSRNESFQREKRGFVRLSTVHQASRVSRLEGTGSLTGRQSREIRRWRREASRAKTERLRPDLIRQCAREEED